MNFTYKQSSGILLDPAGVCLAAGYSGAGEYKNKPDCQDVPGEGPIPQGEWAIVALFVDGVTHPGQPPHGPYVLQLAPKAGTNTFGRGGFLMHGDEIAHPGSASKGCIIMPRKVREQVWTSGVRDLTVTA